MSTNALIETFWGRLQTELLNRKTWTTVVELSMEMARPNKGVLPLTLAEMMSVHVPCAKGKMYQNFSE
jgi:hypothetical protein